MDESAQPTTDSLFLEMLDLLHVCFPQIPQSATISFLPSNDGARACLSDMECQAAPESGYRPELGYDDEDLLASMNAVVGDLVESIRQQNNPIEHPGRIVLKRLSGDGEMEVSVYEDQPESEPFLLQKRIFDFSELQMLIHTELLFQTLTQSEVAEDAQSEWLSGLLDNVASYELDVETPAFTFSTDQNEIMASFEPALLATYVPTAHSFLWGWAQEQFPEHFIKRTHEIPKQMSEPGLRAFHQPELLCPKVMAERLVKHASVALGAKGVYVLEKEGNAGPLLLFVGLFEPSATLAQ